MNRLSDIRLSRLMLYGAVILMYYGLGEGGWGYVLLALVVFEVCSGFKGSVTLQILDFFDKKCLF